MRKTLPRRNAPDLRKEEEIIQRMAFCFQGRRTADSFSNMTECEMGMDFPVKSGTTQLTTETVGFCSSAPSSLPESRPLSSSFPTGVEVLIRLK